MTERRYNQQRKPEHHKKKKGFHPIKLFFKLVVSIVMSFLILSSGAAFAYYKITGESPFGGYVGLTNASDLNLLDAMLKKDMKLNIAVFGTDKEGTRTDVMFVLHYDSANESLDLVSLPRDTRISICNEVIADYEKHNHVYNKVTKLNAVHSYSGKDNACENTVLQIEDLLGIDVQHYVKVDLDAFRKIVDTVGGVEVDVPQDMHYSDPSQDLYIDLKAGMQTLNGDQAEQLVRFRKYPTGDEGRIKVQQLFLNALANKVLNTESVLKNMPKYISIVYKDIETDISLKDIMKYANYIEKLDSSKITMQTLPGTGQYIGGVSYFVHDAEETATLVDEIFYRERTDSTTTESGDSKDLTIEVSNGGGINGLAGQYTEKLKAQGYTVTAPTNYTGQQMSQTRIQVKSDGVGSDLISYFANAKVEVAPKDLPSGVDIRIILGTEER